jgi:hypothetical protein
MSLVRSRIENFGKGNVRKVAGCRGADGRDLQLFPLSEGFLPFPSLHVSNNQSQRSQLINTWPVLGAVSCRDRLLVPVRPEPVAPTPAELVNLQRACLKAKFHKQRDARGRPKTRTPLFTTQSNPPGDLLRMDAIISQLQDLLEGQIVSPYNQPNPPLSFIGAMSNPGSRISMASDLQRGPPLLFSRFLL